MRSRGRAAHTTAAAAGVVLWVATAVLSGRREAWDAEWYWVVTYPLSGIVAASLAYAMRPRRAWSLGLTVMVAQAAALVVTARSFALLPLGLILFAVLAVPAVVLSGIAGWLGSRAVRPRQSEAGG